MSRYQRALDKLGTNLETLDEPATTTPADEAARQERNLKEWQLSFEQSNSPEQRQILLDERKNNPQDFPPEVRNAKPTYDGMQFHILGRTTDSATEKQSKPGATGPGMNFHVLKPTPGERIQPPEGEYGFEAPLTAPGERAYTPAGAVTGRTMVPPPRNDIRGPGSPDQAAFGRTALETGGSFLGGSVGAVVGGAGGTLLRPGPGTGMGVTVGTRIGEGVGAGLGSLLSETFDPTPHPIDEALKTAGVVTGTGFLASGVTGGLRTLIGKPHEAGQALINVMQARGQIPLPGAVLESEFIRNAQSFGSAAFGTNELLKKAQANMEGITSEAVQNYVSGFQRYHDSAKNLFSEIDQSLSRPTVPTQVGVQAQSGAVNVTAPGARLFLKADERARDAMLDVAQNWVNRTGRVDAMPTGLQKMYVWAQQGGPAPKMTFEETQQVYDALYNKARALDFAAKNRDVSELGGTNTAAYVREQAKRVKNAFDEQLDAAISSKAVDPNTKVKLVAARRNWNLWTQGQEMERMVAAATKDIEGVSTVKGSKLLNEIDKLSREDAKIGGAPTLEKTQVDSLRRYALAARAAEDSGKQGAFVLAGRAGQLIGLGGALTGGFGSGASGFLLVAPHVIAASFSNPKISSMLIRGLRMEPGSAAAWRLGRELLSVWEKEGLIGPEYNEGPQELPSSNPQSPKYVPN